MTCKTCKIVTEHCKSRIAELNDYDEETDCAKQNAFEEVLALIPESEEKSSWAEMEETKKLKAWLNHKCKDYYCENCARKACRDVYHELEFLETGKEPSEPKEPDNSDEYTGKPIIETGTYNEKAKIEPEKTCESCKHEDTTSDNNPCKECNWKKGRTNWEAKDVFENEDLAKRLHLWYIEAIQNLSEENYNPKAVCTYKELTEEQKSIDRYIAKKLTDLLKKAIRSEEI